VLGTPSPAGATTACPNAPGDFGTQYVSAAWSSQFTGVPVYSNYYTSANKGINSTNCTNYVTTPSGKSVPSGYEWQCVELVNRLYLTEGWISARWAGNGSQLYANAPAGLKKEPQNSITYLAPGDVISFSVAGSSAGHAAVVSQVTASDAITFVNQNTPYADRFSSGQLSGGKLTMTGWASKFVPIGAIHAPRLSRPAQPANARVTATTATSATLSWTDTSYNETGFLAQYKIGSGSWVARQSVGANQTSMTITGLKANTKYTFQVGSTNSAGTNWGPYFYGSTAKTASAPPPPPPPPPAPGPYHTGKQVSVDKYATGGDSGHTGPGNNYLAGPLHQANSALWIVCYVNGQSITNSHYNDTTPIWDLATDGYYYSDAWLFTGTNGAAVPPCHLKTVSVDKYATGGDSGHTGPGNNYSAGPLHAANTPITIACYVNGQSITNSHYNDTTPIWDLATDGYYYSDAWLFTGTNGAAVPPC
jgi:hypothetical protein